MEVLIKVDKLNETHINQIYQLGELYYSKGDNLLNKDYLHWLYLLNPLGCAKGCLSYHGDDLIGIIVLIPIKISGINLDCFYACNVLTHPNYRNQNLFIKMIRIVKDNFKHNNFVLIGHPNKTSIPGWRRTKMKFQTALKPKLFFSNPLKRNAQRYRGNETELDSFFDKVSLISLSNNNTKVDMDSAYFKWRYIDCPVQLYSVFLTKKDERVNGIYVTKKLNNLLDLVVYSNSYESDYDLTSYNSFLTYNPKVAYFSEDIFDTGKFKSKLFSLDKLDKELNYFFTQPNDIERIEKYIQLGLECTDI